MLMQCGEQTHSPLGLCLVRTTMLLFSFVAVFLVESGEDTDVFSTHLYPSRSDSSAPEAHAQPLGLKNGLTWAAGVKLQTTNAGLDSFNLGASHWAGFAGGDSRLRCGRFALLLLLMARLWKCRSHLMEGGHTSVSSSQRSTVWDFSCLLNQANSSDSYLY